MKGFKLEKTWRSSGVANTTFNASGNFSVPFGKSVIGITGRGGTGNPSSYTPGTTNPAVYEPGNTNPPVFTPGNTNPPSYTPGNTNSPTYTPGNYAGETFSEATYTSNIDYGSNYNVSYCSGGSCPSPYSFGDGYFYQSVDYSCSPYYNPGSTTPGTTNPGYYSAGTTNPGSTNPGSTNPAYYAPGTNNPAYYDPGSTGTPTTVLGVYFPGGAIGSVAPTIGVTPVNPYSYTYPNSYSITVPTGGYITIQLL